jgi:hypothetical protein
LLAALRVVFKLFIVEEKLLTSSEDKLLTAVYALEDSILKFHGRLPREGKIESALNSTRRLPVSLFSFVFPQPGPGPHKHRAANLGVSVLGDDYLNTPVPYRRGVDLLS